MLNDKIREYEASKKMLRNTPAMYKKAYPFLKEEMCIRDRGMVVQKVLTFLPKFEIYKNGSYIGCLSKEFSFLTPHYNIDYNGWHIDGTIMEWDYSILDQSGYLIARVNKELFHMSDTYVIDVQDPGNTLDALMFVLAIDAEKCSRN